MGNRKTAVYRLFAGFYGSIAEAVGLTIGGLLGIGYGLLWICWQLLTGSDANTDGKIATAIQRLLQWPINLYIFAFTGKGTFQWLP